MSNPYGDIGDRVAEVLREFLRCDSDGYRLAGREWINITNLTEEVIRAVVHNKQTRRMEPKEDDRWESRYVTKWVPRESA